MLKLAKWTKNINIFDKKLLIIPINIALHWSLAIITNPGCTLKLKTKQEDIYDLCRNKIFSLISSSIFAEPSWVNTLQSNAKILAIKHYPFKILHFDSMRGCHPTNNIYDNLRIYLKMMCGDMDCDKLNVIDSAPGVSLGVPQQTNSADCGVYLLHFAQLFALNPFFDSGNSLTRNQWFKQKHIATKRNYIKELCIKLRREQGKPDIDIEDIEEIEDVEEIEEIEDIV
eukprot:UN12042